MSAVRTSQQSIKEKLCKISNNILEIEYDEFKNEKELRDLQFLTKIKEAKFNTSKIILERAENLKEILEVQRIITAEVLNGVNDLIDKIVAGEADIKIKPLELYLIQCWNLYNKMEFEHLKFLCDIKQDHIEFLKDLSNDLKNRMHALQKEIGIEEPSIKHSTSMTSLNKFKSSSLVASKSYQNLFSQSISETKPHSIEPVPEHEAKCRI